MYVSPSTQVFDFTVLSIKVCTLSTMTSMQEYMHDDTAHTTQDAAMQDAKEADYGSVDMQDFNALSTRMGMLEHNFAALNSNVT